MSYRSDEEIRASYVGAMGEDFGVLFHAIHNELVVAHLKWINYVELFGTSPERIDVINRIAPEFFGFLQGLMLDDIILHISRLVDRPTISKKNTLSMRALAEVCRVDLRDRVEKISAGVINDLGRLRDLRGNRIAHRNREQHLNGASLVPPVSRKEIRDSLACVGAALNEIAGVFGVGPVTYEATIPPLGGAEALVRFMTKHSIVEPERFTGAAAP